MNSKKQASTLTAADLYAAEQECWMAHRKLGIRKSRNAATQTDYRNADRASRKLDRIAKALKH